MNLHEHGSELLKALEVSKAFKVTTSTLVSNSEIELVGLHQLDTCLCVGEHEQLTSDNPIFIVGDVNGNIRSAARLSQQSGLLLLTSSQQLTLRGGMKADDLVTLMFAISAPLAKERFKVTLFRNDHVQLVPSIRKLDLTVSRNFTEATKLSWPVLLRARTPSAQTNYCKTYSFCANAPTDDKCCNAFTGQCHHDC